MASLFGRPSMVAMAASMLCANAAPTAIPDPAVVNWTRAHVVPMGGIDDVVSPAEAAAIRKIVAGARVIGLGEPFHGHEEPLAYRNRLIRDLVAHEGLTAVALETGIAETKQVGDYVLGGPGNARDIVFKNLSWRFNDLQANVDLVVWLRSWNLAHPRKMVRLYGIDVSGGDDKAEFGRSRASLDYLIAYLERAVPGPSTAVRARLAALADRFSNAGYAAMDDADRRRLDEALTTVKAFLEDQQTALIRSPSRADYDWALRIANDSQDAVRIFAVWPNDPNQPMPGAARVAVIRDKAMAANTLWALSREGARGRILLFESNTHVAAAPMVRPGGESEPGTSAGQELRKALGGSYRVIVTASSLGRNSADGSIGSVDRVLVAAGRPRAWLDLRTAPIWWDSPQTLAHGGARVNAVTPKKAFDSIAYVETLTPAKLIAKEPVR